jgi:hypothetical protein
MTTQTRFVKVMFILDNVFLVLKLWWVNENDYDLVIFYLILRKCITKSTRHLVKNL